MHGLGIGYLELMAMNTSIVTECYPYSVSKYILDVLHREPLWGTFVIRYRNDFHWQNFFQFLWQILFELVLLNRTFSAETESGHIFGI